MITIKKIILISGKAENGKSELANFLKQELSKKNNRVLIIPFAKYLKIILQDYYGWNGTKDEWFRTMAQYIGTDVIRHKLKNPLFHVKRVMEDIEVIQDDVEYVIVDDCRFSDEVYYSQAKFPNDIITIRVHRLDYKSSLTKEQLKHESEIDLDDFNFDYNIYAQSSVEHLQDEARRVLKGVLL